MDSEEDGMILTKTISLGVIALLVVVGGQFLLLYLAFTPQPGWKLAFLASACLYLSALQL